MPLLITGAMWLEQKTQICFSYCVWKKSGKEMQVLTSDCKDAETDERMHQKMVEQMDG